MYGTLTDEYNIYSKKHDTGVRIEKVDVRHWDEIDLTEIYVGGRRAAAYQRGEDCRPCENLSRRTTPMIMDRQFVLNALPSILPHLPEEVKANMGMN